MSFSVFEKLCHRQYNQIWSIFTLPPKSHILISSHYPFSHSSCSCCLRPVTSVVSGPAQPCGLQPDGLLCPWDSPARVLESVAMLSSRGSSRPRDQTQAFCIAGRFFTTEPPGKPHNSSPRRTIIYLLY